MCRIIPFTMPETQGQPVDNSPVNKMQLKALEQAMAVAVKANAEEQTHAGLIAADERVRLRFMFAFGTRELPELPARHYRAALAWLAAESQTDEREPWQVELESALQDVQCRLNAFTGYASAVARLTALVESQLAPMIASRLAEHRDKPKR